VAVEGTAIIAQEFHKKLRRRGLTIAAIEKMRKFRNAISVLEEAAIAAHTRGVSAMHDITEGGLATALTELSAAGGHRLRVDKDRIPIFPETAEICRLFGIDPLGLIGSGSLLICCRALGSARLVKRVQQAGIEITCIGEVLDPGSGIHAVHEGRPAPWPSFDADELTRLFYSG
jgi:hydrogenase maturation factor